jgi:tyrosinase
VSPESIEEVLSLGDYESFVAMMEGRVHDVIPYGISGDFETFTAPYDPLFFLHHAQLDRLWWLWQLRQPEGGLEAYGGHKERHSMVMATLDDEIGMGALAPPVRVRELMDIHGEMLGYEY